MQWLMLQQDKPQDFVIATGEQYSVRDFVNMSAAALGLTLTWHGSEKNEYATVEEISGDDAPALEKGQVIVRVDPRYYRPTEVETLLGDPSKAKRELGWTPTTSTAEMTREMVAADLAKAKQNALLTAHGYAPDHTVEH
jgi:GDPmannose 4,6-dehydratase